MIRAHPPEPPPRQAENTGCKPVPRQILTRRLTKQRHAGAGLFEEVFCEDADVEVVVGAFRADPGGDEVDGGEALRLDRFERRKIGVFDADVAAAFRAEETLALVSHALSDFRIDHRDADEDREVGLLRDEPREPVKRARRTGSSVKEERGGGDFGNELLPRDEDRDHGLVEDLEDGVDAPVEHPLAIRKVGARRQDDDIGKAREEKDLGRGVPFHEEFTDRHLLAGGLDDKVGAPPAEWTVEEVFRGFLPVHELFFMKRQRHGFVGSAVVIDRDEYDFRPVFRGEGKGGGGGGFKALIRCHRK